MVMSFAHFASTLSRSSRPGTRPLPPPPPREAGAEKSFSTGAKVAVGLGGAAVAGGAVAGGLLGAHVADVGWDAAMEDLAHGAGDAGDAIVDGAEEAGGRRAQGLPKSAHHRAHTVPTPTEVRPRIGPKPTQTRFRRHHTLGTGSNRTSMKRVAPRECLKVRTLSSTASTPPSSGPSWQLRGPATTRNAQNSEPKACGSTSCGHCTCQCSHVSLGVAAPGIGWQQSLGRSAPLNHGRQGGSAHGGRATAKRSLLVRGARRTYAPRRGYRDGTWL